MALDSSIYCAEINNDGLRLTELSEYYCSYYFSKYSGFIIFTKDKAKPEDIGLWNIPEEAVRIEFEKHNLNGSSFIIPVFYNRNGNVLKRGNR